MKLVSKLIQDYNNAVLYHLFLLLASFLAHAGCLRRNILLLLADDAGFATTAYNNTVCHTPSLDKLAERSVVFDNAFTVVSGCSPSRSVILTGLPAHQNGHYGLQGYYYNFQSTPGVKSISTILSNRGIRTGIVGKKHVDPREIYTFDFEATDDFLTRGRNMTYLREQFHDFLVETGDRPFFFVVGFYDTHRARIDHIEQYGAFAEYFGNGEPGNGYIPDWTPIHYDPDEIIMPPHLPDTQTSRSDFAAMYTSFNRMDQGVGLILKELEEFGAMSDTLVIFTSDNGIPFPLGKADMYEASMRIPLTISSPEHRATWGQHSGASVSLLDFVPTVFDWFQEDFENYNIVTGTVELTGRSLLPLLEHPDAPGYDLVFGSNDYHEVAMSYPRRMIRKNNLKLIHNINFPLPYTPALDVLCSQTFQEILTKETAGELTGWIKTLDEYYHRPQYELYALDTDPLELNNLAYHQDFVQTVVALNSSLKQWEWQTHDPWRCHPTSVFQLDGCWPLFDGTQYYLYSGVSKQYDERGHHQWAYYSFTPGHQRSSAPILADSLMKSLCFYIIIYEGVSICSIFKN